MEVLGVVRSSFVFTVGKWKEVGLRKLKRGGSSMGYGALAWSRVVGVEEL